MLSSLSPVIHWQDVGLHDLQTPREGEGGQAVSDTPRTDEAWMYDSDNIKTVGVDFAVQLERELNAANDRIKRLEDAGDALKAAGYFGGFGSAVNKWNKAKEAKP